MSPRVECCAAWTPQRADGVCHGREKPHVARSAQILVAQVQFWATAPAVARRGRIVCGSRWVKTVVSSVGQVSACGDEAKDAALLKSETNVIEG